MIGLTTLSLSLNGMAAFLLYRDGGTTVNTHGEKRVTDVPLEYETFRQEWGEPWIGVEVTDVSPQVAARAMLDRPEGALITDVAKGSPAARADMSPGDVILSFNGRKIRTARQFENDLSGSEVGIEIYMCIAKTDRRITVYVVPDERPSYLPPATKAFPWLGIEIKQVLSGSSESEKLDEAGKAGGVLVAKVIAGSPADRAGLQKDDIIMSFNSRKTRTVREFLTDLAGCEPGDNVRMCIVRDDYRTTVYAVLERSPVSYDV